MHLRYHLPMVEVSTTDESSRYAALRGYDDSGQEHPPHSQPHKR